MVIILAGVNDMMGLEVLADSVGCIVWCRSFNDICRISSGYSILPDHQAVACRLNKLRRDDVKLVHAVRRRSTVKC
jgi:hypothetical protein